MSTWYSSNPSTRSERTRWRRCLALCLLAATAAAAQPLRQVVVEFRIEPGSTLDQDRLRAPGVVADIERAIAQVAEQEFLFLDWLSSTETAQPGAFGLQLRLYDGPVGGCTPPSVRARFRAEREGVEAWSYPELEFTELCDLGAPEISPAQMKAKATELAARVIDDVDEMAQLAERFLSEVVLARELEADFDSQKLFLPVRGLKAKPESQLEVRFENSLGRTLHAHPGDLIGDRTQLFVERFQCDEIAFEPPGTSLLPRTWHPRLRELFEACREPFVYMKRYVPNPLEVDAGVVTSWEEGGAQ